MTRDEKRREWAGVMERWRESGLSRAGFCREYGVKPWQFQYWQRRLTPPPERPESAGFVPVRFSAEPVGCGLTLVVGTVRLELATHFDEVSLVRVLAVLGQCAC